MLDIRRLILISSYPAMLSTWVFFVRLRKAECWSWLAVVAFFFVYLFFFSLWSFDDFFEIVVVFDNYKKHHHHHKSMFGQTGLYLQQERWGGRRHLSCCFVFLLKFFQRFGFSLVFFLSKWVVYKAKCEFVFFDDCYWWSAASPKKKIKNMGIGNQFVFLARCSHTRIQL